MPTPTCPFTPADARPVGRPLNPAELVEALAPAILQAKDQGSQFIVAVNDPAFPFAADAELPPTKEGSAKFFDWRRQLYAGVLGEVGAEERRGEMVRES